MSTDRVFADFYEGAESFQMSRIPDGGMCLSAFLVLWKKSRSNVLLGKVNPDYDWIKIGALSKESTTRISSRWMLPASHLLLYESPQSAAERILVEQLDMKEAVELQGPIVFSEVYDAPKLEIKNHWDTEFVFTGEITGDAPKNHLAWSELRFVDVGAVKDSEISRSHQDILTEVGIRTRSS